MKEHETSVWLLPGYALPEHIITRVGIMREKREKGLSAGGSTKDGWDNSKIKYKWFLFWPRIENNSMGNSTHKNNKK